MQTKHELLRFAIQKRLQVTGVYQGHDRVFCPHILGQMRGQWAIRGWQFGGTSSRPERLPDWSNFYLTDLIDLTSRTGDWHRGWVNGKGRPNSGFESIDTVAEQEYGAQLRHTSTPRILGLGLRHPGRRR